jgi:hypothetical protein
LRLASIVVHGPIGQKTVESLYRDSAAGLPDPPPQILNRHEVQNALDWNPSLESCGNAELDKSEL